MLHFLQSHRNWKLVKLSVIQAVVVIGIFFCFLLTMNVIPYYAFVFAIIGFLALAALFRLLNLPFFILPMIRGPVYVPSSDLQIEKMIKLAKVKKGQKAIDVGAGDGRVVIALSQAGAKVVGVELNPDMVSLAEKNIAEAGQKNAKILWQNFWDVDFSTYDVVTVYGFPSIMSELEAKLIMELRPGARVVTNQYPFPHWELAKKDGKVFLYIVE
jgi:SAM-dependent methyltransferase